MQEKSHFLVFFYSAGYRRALNRWRILGNRDSRDGNPSSRGEEDLLGEPSQVSLDRWQGTGNVLDGDGLVSKWYRSGIGVVTRKKAERDRGMAGGR